MAPVFFASERFSSLREQRPCGRLRRALLQFQQIVPIPPDHPEAAYFFSSSSLPRLRRCLIHQPLPNDALQQPVGAHRIVHADRDPIAVTEVEFVQVAMQMVARAMLIDATHAALEHGKEAFDSVRVNVAGGKPHL